MINAFTQKFKHMILISLLILVVSIAAIAVHYRVHLEEARSNFLRSLEKETALCETFVSKELDMYCLAAAKTAEQIRTLSLATERQIASALLSAEQNGVFSQAFYIDMDKYVITSGAQMLRLMDSDDYEIVDELEYQDGASVAQMFKFLKNEDIIGAIAPVVREGTEGGYFVGLFDAESVFSTITEAEHRFSHTIFVVDTEGGLVWQYPEEDEDTSIPGLSVLLDLEGTKSAFEHIRQKKSGTEKVDVAGSTYWLNYQPIERSEKWAVLIVVSADSVNSLLQGGSMKSGAFLAMSVLLMTGLVIYIALCASKTRRRMEQIAYRDGQTGAANQTYFLETAASRIASEKELPYVVAKIDILNFRYINEAFGHERGNQILQWMVDYAKDNFGSKELFARNSADQFTALMVSVGDIELRMERFTESINEYARTIDVNFPIILRAGYYPVGNGQDTLNDIIDKANVARKTLNRDSKTYTIRYTEEMQNEIKRREHIESAMDYALGHGEFHIYLQPKYDLLEKKVSGAEALVRWIREDGSMVYPDEFIPVFEQNGFIEKLDFYMLENLCSRMYELMQEGREIFPVSVNQSRVLLLNPSYVSHVIEILERYHVAKGKLELEVTETVFFNEKKKMIAIMNELKQNDVLIDMDDFGSGYSSLNMLKDVPFDIIKIDRGFFSESASSESAKWILKKVVEMAEGLGVECICEGVETEEQADILRSIECRYAQGYLYGKPMPMEDFIEKYVY